MSDRIVAERMFRATRVSLVVLFGHRPTILS